VYKRCLCARVKSVELVKEIKAANFLSCRCRGTTTNFRTMLAIIIKVVGLALNQEE